MSNPLSNPHSGAVNAAPVDSLLLSLNGAACALGLGRRKTWELAQSGEIPTIRIGRRRLVPRAALEQWIADRTEGGGR